MKIDKVQRFAAEILKTGRTKLWFDPNESEKIDSAITKEDCRQLIKDGIIRERKDNFYSRGRARILHDKKKKGRKKGFGKRSGKKSARVQDHRKWIQDIRAQRKKLVEMREKFPEKVKKIGYGKIYKKIKGGFFKGKKYVEAHVKGVK